MPFLEPSEYCWLPPWGQHLLLQICSVSSEGCKRSTTVKRSYIEHEQPEHISSWDRTGTHCRIPWFDEGEIPGRSPLNQVICTNSPVPQLGCDDKSHLSITDLCWISENKNIRIFNNYSWLHTLKRVKNIIKGGTGTLFIVVFLPKTFNLSLLIRKQPER